MDQDFDNNFEANHAFIQKHYFQYGETEDDAIWFTVKRFLNHGPKNLRKNTVILGKGNVPGDFKMVYDDVKNILVLRNRVKFPTIVEVELDRIDPTNELKAIPKIIGNGCYVCHNYKNGHMYLSTLNCVERSISRPHGRISSNG